jgi:hypothetical protein
VGNSPGPARNGVTPLERHDIERAADRAWALLGPDAYAAAEHAVLTQPQDHPARLEATPQR